MKTKDEIIRRLMVVIEEVTLGNITISQMTPGTQLMEDAGLDSLDYASVMLEGEEYVEAKLNENQINWSSVKTIDDLANLLFEAQ